MKPVRVLSTARAELVRQAFLRWYKSRQDKPAAIRSLGPRVDSRSDHRWRSGLRVPPPFILAKLYQKTGDRDFLLTGAEKQEYRRRNHRGTIIPDERGWPDLDAADRKADPSPAAAPSVAQALSIDLLTAVGVVKLAIRLTRAIAELPDEDPIREQARRELLPVSLELRAAVERLGFKYPPEVEDLLRPIDKARNTMKTIFGAPGTNKKR